MVLSLRRDSTFVPLLMGLMLCLIVSQAASSLSTGALAEEEAPDTSCVGCHAGGVPEGPPPGAGETVKAMVRMLVVHPVLLR